MFTLVGPHDPPFLLLFPIFISSLAVYCSLSPLLCSWQPGAAVSEGKWTKEAGAVSPATTHCEERHEVLSHSALHSSAPRWRAQLCIQKMLPASRVCDTQSIWFNILGGIILPHADPLKIICVFMNISQSTQDTVMVSPHFSLRGLWEPGEQYSA